mmetsp:Transcript_43904/g.85883  ORF Transcript_43904/g.85883 Transcript_43904/m.85883 type:complete len:335 (+) Transcript_43904:39-1043(+)
MLPLGGINSQQSSSSSTQADSHAAPVLLNLAETSALLTLCNSSLLHPLAQPPPQLQTSLPREKNGKPVAKWQKTAVNPCVDCSLSRSYLTHLEKQHGMISQKYKKLMQEVKEHNEWAKNQQIPGQQLSKIEHCSSIHRFSFVPAAVSTTVAADTTQLTHGQCQVFLGGACNPTSWRADLAVPLFESQGITFYNPQRASWHSGMVKEEATAKESAELLLFVISDQTAGFSSMIEVAEHIGRGRQVVLTIQFLPKNAKINNRDLCEEDIANGNRARKYLEDVALRHGVKVHTEIQSALQECVQRLTAKVALNQTPEAESAAGEIPTATEKSENKTE